MELISQEGLLKIFHKLKSIALNHTSQDLDYGEFCKEVRPLIEVINNISSSLAEINMLANSLSKGELNDIKLSKTNYLSGHFKELHAKLTYLTWQAKQIQNGNYDQRLEFFGDLSQSVNAMVIQLAEREAELKTQVAISEQTSEDYKKLISVMETVLDNVSERIYVLDCRSDAVVYMNKTAKNHLQEGGGTHLCKRGCSVYNQMVQMKETLEAMSTEYFCRLSKRWHRLTSNPILWAGGTMCVLHVEKDITDTKEMQSLEQIAYYDTATGAYNRRYAFDTLEELFREKAQVAVCFIDLDDLKGVNDNYGHAAGDEYIMSVYKAIFQSLREEDCVCRIGGDEFVAILKGATIDVAKRIAAKVNVTLCQLSQNGSQPYKYSVSIGIAVSDYEVYDTVDKLLEAADERMYEKKKLKKTSRSRNRSKG